MSRQEFTEQMKVILTEEEKQQHAEAMAKAHGELNDLKSQQKEAAADYKSRITAKEIVLSNEARLVNNGYEYRSVRCRWELNKPEQGEKTAYRTDTGAFVRIAAMNDDDFQLVLKLEAEEKAEQENSEAEDSGESTEEQSEAETVEPTEPPAVAQEAPEGLEIDDNPFADD